MVRKQDDFYTAINQTWLAEVTLAPDQVQRGSFSDLAAKNAERLQALLGEAPADDQPALQAAKQLYALALDVERRESEGPFPVQPMAEKILGLRNLADLQAQAAEFIFADISTPFSFHVAADMGDNQTQTLYADAPRTILPDTTYYVDDSVESEQLIEVWIEQAFTVLNCFGFGNQDSGKLIENALVFDKLLSAAIMTATEADDPWNHYHPTTLVAFQKYSQFVDLAALTEQLVGHRVPKVTLQQQRYWENLDELVNPQTFPLIKSWMLIKALVDATPYLTEKLRQAGGQYHLALTGAKALVAPANAAFEKVNEIYEVVLGTEYAKRYLTVAAKQAVAAMVTAVRDTYQARLAANTWLSTATQQQAQAKLAQMTVKLGAPQQLPSYYAQLVVDPQASYYINIKKLQTIQRQAYFSQAGAPVDPTTWQMGAARVNAYYDNSRNEIVFPAGILQPPFYGIEQSAATNYGGLGTIIAHEITHAFDTKGAHTNAAGNLSDWWREHDYQAFVTQARRVEQQFSGHVVNGMPVNAQQTLAENVADNGGVAVALATLKTIAGGADLSAFFENFARSWRTVVTADYRQLHNSMDAHSPAQLRVNITLSNFTEFLDAYQVQPTDEMWRESRERVQIW